MSRGTGEIWCLTSHLPSVMREHVSKHLIWMWKFQLHNLAEDFDIGDHGNASYLAGMKNYFLTSVASKRIRT
jgi:hypothetical protein